MFLDILCKHFECFQLFLCEIAVRTFSECLLNVLVFTRYLFKTADIFRCLFYSIFAIKHGKLNISVYLLAFEEFVSIISECLWRENCSIRKYRCDNNLFFFISKRLCIERRGFQFRSISCRLYLGCVNRWSCNINMAHASIFCFHSVCKIFEL